MHFYTMTKKAKEQIQQVKKERWRPWDWISSPTAWIEAWWGMQRIEPLDWLRGNAMGVSFWDVALSCFIRALYGRYALYGPYMGLKWASYATCRVCNWAVYIGPMRCMCHYMIHVSRRTQPLASRCSHMHRNKNNTIAGYENPDVFRYIVSTLSSVSFVLIWFVLRSFVFPPLLLLFSIVVCFP